jgi:hypothetical protein
MLKTFFYQVFSLVLQSFGGADCYAIPTEYAGRIRKRVVIKSGYLTVMSSTTQSQGIGILHIISTSLDTAPA